MLGVEPTVPAETGSGVLLSQLSLYELLIGEVTSGLCIGRFIEPVLKVVLLLVWHIYAPLKLKLNQPKTPETLVDDIQTHSLPPVRQTRLQLFFSKQEMENSAGGKTNSVIF